MLVLAAAVVFALALTWRDGSPLRVDLAVFQFFSRHRAPRLTRAVARLGAREVVLPLGLVLASAIAWRRRSWRPIVLVLVTYVVASAPAALLKEALHRPEPGDAAGSLGRSFPSGHATQALAVYGAVALAYAADASTRAGRIAVAVAALAGVAVGVAMVARGAHWLTDVLAGWAIATAALVVVAGAQRGRRWTTSPAVTTRGRPPSSTMS